MAITNAPNISYTYAETVSHTIGDDTIINGNLVVVGDLIITGDIVKASKFEFECIDHTELLVYLSNSKHTLNEDYFIKNSYIVIRDNIIKGDNELRSLIVELSL